MVSTRSGRSVGPDAPSAGQAPRATRTNTRSRKVEENIELGHAEVTSPMTPVGDTPYRGQDQTPGQPTPHRSPLLPVAQSFGSPLPENLVQTPAGVGATPMSERVVKTIGRTPNVHSDSPKPPVQTPMAVRQVADMPLPDDGGETEPFQSSDDDAAPDTAPAAAGTAGPRRSARSNSPGPLLISFTALSVLATLLLALLLAPCGDPHLFGHAPQQLYAPLCREVVQLRGRVEDTFLRISTAGKDQLSRAHGHLPPQAQQLLRSASDPILAAHASALPLLRSYSSQAQQRLSPALLKAKDAWQDLTHKAVPKLFPVLTTIAHRIHPTPSSPSIPAGSPSPKLGLPLDALLAIVATDVPRAADYARETYAAAATQIAEKRKAPAWVVTCRSGPECTRAFGTAMAEAECVKNVDGPSLGDADSAGELQAELVAFLRSCPSGLVVLQGLERMHPQVVAVLNAALSEGGHLQMDGGAVATHTATFLLLASEATAFVVRNEGVEPLSERFDFRVRKHIEDAITAAASGQLGQEPSDATAAAAIALSFRRRLDAVLPAARVEPPGGTGEQGAGWATMDLGADAQEPADA